MWMLSEPVSMKGVIWTTGKCGLTMCYIASARGGWTIRQSLYTAQPAGRPLTDFSLPSISAARVLKLPIAILMMTSGHIMAQQLQVTVKSATSSMLAASDLDTQSTRPDFMLVKT